MLVMILKAVSTSKSLLVWLLLQETRWEVVESVTFELKYASNPHRIRDLLKCSIFATGSYYLYLSDSTQVREKGE